MAPKPETQFFRACRLGNADTVRQLLAVGLSPETRDTYGLTGLIWAARKGQIEVAKVLLTFRASLEAKDRRNRTALHHAVAFKQHEFVRFVATRGGLLNSIDAHGYTPLDLAADGMTMSLLESLGAQRAATAEGVRLRGKGRNGFSLPAVTGGTPAFIVREQQQLRLMFTRWTGDYSSEVKDFVFFLFVDGRLIRYTKSGNICGAQSAKRIRGSLQVKIGVPEGWWKPNPAAHKKYLADAIEEGLHSMIALMRRNKHQIDTELLLSDWERIKQKFLANPPEIADA